MKIDKLIEEVYESAITGLNLVDNNTYLVSNKYKNLEKRLGFVEIDKDLLLNFEINEFKSIFSNFFPIYLDGILLGKPHDLKYIKYFGISEHFEVVKEGCIIPEYKLWIKRDSNGKATFDRMEKI